MAVNLPFSSNLGGMVSGVFNILMWFIVGAFVLVIVLVIGRIMKKKKQYNIPVTIWIPRSDNKIVDEFSAVGGYFKSKAVGGITSFRIKRKGVSVVEMPPPESRFLVGLSRHLYLVQKGVDDYEPVLPESFMTVELERTFEWKNPKTGKIENKPIRKAVVNLKCKNQDATAWAFDNEENAKRRFTFASFWEKYKDMLEVALLVMVIIIANIMVWKGLQGVADSLKEVANILRPAIENAPIVS